MFKSKTIEQEATGWSWISTSPLHSSHTQYVSLRGNPLTLLSPPLYRNIPAEPTLQPKSINSSKPATVSHTERVYPVLKALRARLERMSGRASSPRKKSSSPGSVAAAAVSSAAATAAAAADTSHGTGSAADSSESRAQQPRRQHDELPYGPEDEVRAFYLRVGQWLRGDLPKSEAAFAYFTCRCQPGFVAVGPTPGCAPVSAWGELDAPKSAHHKAFLDNLFEQHGVHAAGDIKFTVSDFELVSSRGFTQGDATVGRGSSGGTSDDASVQKSSGSFLASCTYVLHEKTDRGTLRKRATCTFQHYPSSNLSTGAASTSFANSDQWILLHEAWIDHPKIVRLEEDLIARRERHSREIVRRTARALKREGLTLASLRFRCGERAAEQQGRHEVVRGSLRRKSVGGSNDEEDQDGDKSKDLDAEMEDVDSDVDTSEDEAGTDGSRDHDSEDDGEDEENTDAVHTMSNSWFVRYERMREEIEQRTALVDPLHFVRAYTRHLVLLLAHLKRIPVMQMFRYPGALLPNTWNRVRFLCVCARVCFLYFNFRLTEFALSPPMDPPPPHTHTEPWSLSRTGISQRLLQNQQLAVMHVFGSLRNFFECRPMLMLFEVRENIIYLRDELTQEMVEDAIEAI